MDFSTSASTLRTQAKSWRNVLQQTNLIEQPLPGLDCNAKELASQALDNIDLAVSQTRRMSKGKDPSSERHFLLMGDRINISRARQASGLAYSLADKSGKLADMIERAGKLKQATAIGLTIDMLLKDNSERLEAIRAGYEALTQSDAEVDDAGDPASSLGSVQDDG